MLIFLVFRGNHLSCFGFPHYILSWLIPRDNAHTEHRIHKRSFLLFSTLGLVLLESNTPISSSLTAAVCPVTNNSVTQGRTKEVSE